MCFCCSMCCLHPSPVTCHFLSLFSFPPFLALTCFPLCFSLSVIGLCTFLVLCQIVSHFVQFISVVVIPSWSLCTLLLACFCFFLCYCSLPLFWVLFRSVFCLPGFWSCFHFVSKTEFLCYPYLSCPVLGSSPVNPDNFLHVNSYRSPKYMPE